MPNRTIYLPEDLDVLSRELGVNLSQVTQQAIRELAASQGDEALLARVEAASARVDALDLHWPERALEVQREESGER